MTTRSGVSTPQTINWVVFLALIAIQFTFALNYLFSKLVMRTVPPLLWGQMRILFTALPLAAFLSFKTQLRPGTAWKYKKELVLFSLLGVVLNQASFLAGLQLTTTANSSLINTMIPVFTIMWVSFFGKERFNGLHWTGFFLAFAGVLVLQNWNISEFKPSTLQGDGLTLLNALSYSIFLYLSPPFFKAQPPLWTTTWLFIAGSFGMAFFSLPHVIHFSWSSLDSFTLLFILGGVVFGTLIPYLLISYVLTQTSSALVAQFVYLQALIASVLGFAFLNEAITVKTLFSASLIFLGLYLSLSRNPFGIRLK